MSMLPFGNLIMKILEDTGYNFGDEEFKEETTKIRKPILSSIKAEIVNGKITKKPSSNEKKRKISS